MPKKLFFTVDLEDFRHLRCKEIGVSPRSGSYYVEKGVEEIKVLLSTLMDHPKITFFTTAQVARDQKQLVRDLVADGHEIACHSFEHEKLSSLNNSQLKETIERATAILEEVSGKKVIGFRAPSFKLPSNKAVFFEILAKQGYLYDSSLLINSRCRIKDPYFNIAAGDSTILEFPIYKYSAVPGIPIRIIGGTYFRLLPISIIKKLLNFVENKGFLPIIWLHPTDFCENYAPFRWKEAVSFSVLESIRWPFEKLSLQVGSSTVIFKLQNLLKDYRLIGPMGEFATMINNSENSFDKQVVNL